MVRRFLCLLEVVEVEVTVIIETEVVLWAVIITLSGVTFSITVPMVDFVNPVFRLV